MLTLTDNFFIARIKKYFIAQMKKHQVITFTLGFFFLNEEIIFWASYLAGVNYLTGKSGDVLFGKPSLNILFAVIGIPLIYFFQWLLVVLIASKFTRESLKEKFLRHPIATITLFILSIILTDLPYRVSAFWGETLAYIFEVIVDYAFICFLWWLLVFWISEKIWKKQRFQWNWYKKILDKIFIILPPLYKFVLGLIVALLLFALLFLLITKLFHYTGSDIMKQLS